MENDWAITRLHHDIKELHLEPVANVTASPVDDDLFSWSVTLVGASGALAGLPLHFHITFPEDYPIHNPVIKYLNPAIPQRSVVCYEGDLLVCLFVELVSSIQLMCRLTSQRHQKVMHMHTHSIVTCRIVQEEATLYEGMDHSLIVMLSAS